MGNHIEEGVVTPGEIMQFCSRYNESGTHQELGEDDFEMPGLQYDVDVRDYNDSGADEHGRPTHEDFHPGMDLRNGIRDSFSPAPNVNPSPLIPWSGSIMRDTISLDHTCRVRYTLLLRRSSRTRKYAIREVRTISGI
jgi:hypothetical protein